MVIMGPHLGKERDRNLGWVLGGDGDKHSWVKAPLQECGDDKDLTLAKVGTGISDEQFKTLYNKLTKEQTNIKNENYVVPKILEPDVWVEPRIVVEVAADEITVSPTHSAGYALRFPRLVKFRDDKGVGQITTLEEVRGMYGA